MRALPAVLLLAATLAGCSGSGEDEVRTFAIHIGWNDDGTQYMEPNQIRVKQGDKVRFVVHNDDDPNRDYNGPSSGKDNFHDVALLGYDGDGDGIKDDIEHEAFPGRAVTTSFKGNDWFVATTKGSFPIICEVKTVPRTHADLGMKGTFLVE